MVPNGTPQSTPQISFQNPNTEKKKKNGDFGRSFVVFQNLCFGTGFGVHLGVYFEVSGALYFAWGVCDHKARCFICVVLFAVAHSKSGQVPSI